MSFPTSSELAALREHLYWGDLETELKTGLAGVDVETGGRRVRLTLRDGRVVVAGLVQEPRSCWVVAYAGNSLMLPLDASKSVIVGALQSIINALGMDLPIPSPYRWGEVEHSPVVDLADVLTARGLDVREVVASNRLRYHATDGTYLDVDGAEGHYLVVSNWDQWEIRLRWHGGICWVADAYAQFDCNRGNRIDLAAALGVSKTRIPRSVPDDVDRHLLANALENLSHRGESWVASWAFDERFSEHDLLVWVPNFLHWLGLKSVSCKEERRGLKIESANAYVRYRPKAVSVADVERLAGVTANHDHVRLLIGRDWPTRAAVRSADRLRVAVFSVSSEANPPWRAHGAVAEAMVPYCMPWDPAVLRRT